jgi:hypothetical protein
VAAAVVRDGADGLEPAIVRRDDALEAAPVMGWGDEEQVARADGEGPCPSKSSSNTTGSSARRNVNATSCNERPFTVSTTLKRYRDRSPVSSSIRTVSATTIVAVRRISSV